MSGRRKQQASRSARCSSKSSPDFAVENYLSAMEALRSKSQDGPGRHGARHAWVQLRDARIFSIQPKLAHAFADAWFDSMGEDEVLPDPDWPEQFPFPVVWLGYDGSFSMAFDQSENWRDIDVPVEQWDQNQTDYGDLIGHLATANGDMWAFLRNKRSEINCFQARSAKDGWPSVEYVMCSEIAPLLIEYVNQKRTFIVSEDTPGLRRRMKMNRKALGLKGKEVIPPPFYRIRMRSKVIKEVAQRVADGMPPSYRHDVRGHERCRIRRGPLPVPQDQREKLEGLGYEIYTVQSLPAEVLVRLAERSIPPKRFAEWMAVKITWVGAHISPADDSLPYIPALRTVDKK